MVNVTRDVKNSFESSGIEYFRVPVLNVKGEKLEVMHPHKFRHAKKQT